MKSGFLQSSFFWIWWRGSHRESYEKKKKKNGEEVEPRIFDGVTVKIENMRSYRSDKDKKSENLNEKERLKRGTIGDNI